VNTPESNIYTGEEVAIGSEGSESTSKQLMTTLGESIKDKTQLKRLRECLEM